jgi:hypothetical protein
MPGFPLAALGAGLGQWAKYAQDQQAQRERQQMLMLQLQNYQQQMQDRQRERQGQEELGRLDLSGPGTSIAPVNPTGGVGVPMNNVGMRDAGPAPPQMGSAGVGRPMPGGGDSNREIATNNFAGMRQPGVPAAGGPMSNPAGWQKFDTPEAGVAGISRQLDRYASGATTGKPLTTLRQIVSTWAPPNENPTDQLIARASQVVGVGPDQPIDVSNPAVKAKLVEAMIRGEQGGRLPVDPSVIQRGIGIGGQNAPPAQMADASGATAPSAAAPQGDLAAEIAKIPMPALPNLDIEAKRRQINQQAPHAPWERKEQALRDWVSAHGKDAERQYDQAMKLYENQRSVVIEQWKERHSDAEWRQRYGIERKDKLADRDATGGTITTGPGGEAFNVQGAGARPIIRSDTGEPLVKEGAKKSPSNITVTGSDGKEIFKGSAHPDPNAKEGESSWIDDRTQKRIEIPDDANLTILGRGGEGRQAAAQMVRLTSGANEARRQIANVARMSNRATTSWFQGLQSEQGHNLTAGLQRTLANAITPDQEQIMSTLGRGIGRSLATLETAGAATGLVALQNSMQQVMPAKGDKVSTVLLKIGEMRQVAEQGIESALASPAVGAKQADLLRGVQDDLRKAVPWTVPDVIDMIQAPGAETYQSFAAKIGLGKKGAAGEVAPAGAAVPPAAVEMLKKDPSEATRKQFDDVFGAGAAAKALGQ